MLDSEALSTQPDAAVFEIAILEFKPETGYVMPMERKAWYMKPTTGHICPETVAWWARQEKTLTFGVADEPTTARVIQSFLLDYHNKDVRLWAKSPSFDCVVLTQFLKRHGWAMPIEFRNWRDVRTLLELAGNPEATVDTTSVEHEAVFDCLCQIDQVVKAWKILSPASGAF